MSTDKHRFRREPPVAAGRRLLPSRAIHSKVGRRLPPSRVGPMTGWKPVLRAQVGQKIAISRRAEVPRRRDGSREIRAWKKAGARRSSPLHSLAGRRLLPSRNFIEVTCSKAKGWGETFCLSPLYFRLRSDGSAGAFALPRRARRPADVIPSAFIRVNLRFQTVFF
jgi:hypothetical protein